MIDSAGGQAQSRDTNNQSRTSTGSNGRRIVQHGNPRGMREPATLPPDFNLSNLATMPEYTKTGFERYVQAEIGVELPIFGHEYFRDVPTTFAPVDRVPVQADYVVGPGDELLIRAWGKIDVDVEVVIDRTGQIYLPRVGAIRVAGIRYDQLGAFIRSAVGRFFKDFDLDVSIGQLRSIQVLVLGYARRPGTYTVSSLSTLANALFESGGPSAGGSMRHAQLKRNNAVVTDLDLYDLILKGDKSKDANLQSGDVIYIPRVGPLVAVSGSINRPAIYELRDSAELGAVLENSGGLTSVASTGRVVLDRLNDHTERVVDEFTLDAEGLKHELKDGDIVRVYAVSPRIGNAVTLRGNVAQPGRYRWHQGMRVSDLIPSRDALIARQYWNERNSLVHSSERDDFSSSLSRRSRLEKERVLTPDGQRALARPMNESEQFAQQDAEQLALGDGQLEDRVGIKEDSASDQNLAENQPDEELAADIRRRATDINWEYAVVERTDQRDLTTQLIPFNLARAIDQPSSVDNQALLVGDIVTVFSQKDIPVSTEARTKFVQIEGEVRAPGLYRVGPGETLRDMVRRSGGISSQAYLFGAELHRESTLKAQKKQLAQMVERMQRELQEQSASVSPGIAPEDFTEARVRIQEQRDFIDKLAQIQPTGRVVLELKPSASALDDVPAMALEDGDKFFIPAKLDTVEVLGSVYNENAFRFKPHKLVPEYVNNAGGFTRGADKAHAFVIRADGTVISRQQHHGFINRFETIRLMPGDAIVVPQRFKTGGVLRSLRDWTQVFSQLALGAAAINVLK
ncbi:MAG TPA: SLBB domain-containing protein [Candidatus Solibacter sp.]|nr:SLBB domain-containing protein [Candidatus Solibacter sp.]